VIARYGEKPLVVRSKALITFNFIRPHLRGSELGWGDSPPRAVCGLHHH
jgi:hypothetical protein